MEDVQKVTDRMRRLCSRREYCCHDLKMKLLAAFDGDDEAAEKVLEVLREEKYVDDRRYAAAYARDKSAIAGWGSVKIRHMLSAKGISREIISEALGEIDVLKADAKLERLVASKYRTLRDDPQWRLKLLRFALGRGYGYEQVNDVIKGLGNEDLQEIDG